MSSYFAKFDTFPESRADRTRLTDSLYAQLVRHGISSDVAHMACDPHKRQFVLEFAQSELSRIEWFHHTNTGAKVACKLNQSENCDVIKGAVPRPAEIRDSWIQSLQAHNTDNSSPISYVATTERQTTLDESCPFSTPPEFHGFGLNSP